MADDEAPDTLTGAAKPLCARCGGDDHVAPECPTLTATGGHDLDEQAEGTR